MADRQKQRADAQATDATDATAGDEAPAAETSGAAAGDAVSAATASGAGADDAAADAAAAGDVGAVLPVRAWAVDARVPLSSERMVKLAGVEP
ncbi:hypothetical protein, partial [Brachybacterium sp.]|uniref:hypothetical protein n=1 Tax=Brachybacterium sp. TaxID=1891286 RepID=UPI0026492FD7